MNGREWLRFSEYQRQRQREELAARKLKDATHDPETCSAFIAWMNGGRVMKWEQFHREWLQRAEHGRINPQSGAGDA